MPLLSACLTPTLLAVSYVYYVWVILPRFPRIVPIDAYELNKLFVFFCEGFFTLAFLLLDLWVFVALDESPLKSPDAGS